MGDRLVRRFPNEHGSRPRHGCQLFHGQPVTVVGADETSEDTAVLLLWSGEAAAGEEGCRRIDHPEAPPMRRQAYRRVWQTPDRKVTKYNLAYINHLVCRLDNGRVLGYDNSHAHHHRHFMGTVSPVEFEDYESLVARFRGEVQEPGR